ncbi:MAG TPA: hypothetical protein VNZ86_13900, partial [Bacteroidia bacterium]|nr:hypothetical protein [Bacteroidia bacterium]
MKTFYNQFLIAAYLLCWLGPETSKAQEGPPAPPAQTVTANDVGVRLGGFSGIGFRHFGVRNNGLEVSLLDWIPGDGAILSGMYERRIPLSSGFSIYLGGGAFLG